MKKNRLTWGTGLMLICGAIILALPWLMDRNNWDKDWDKPAVMPLWKTKGSFDSGNVAFSDEDHYLLSVHFNGSISQWQTSNGKFAALPFAKTRNALWKLSANGEVAAIQRPKMLQKSFITKEWYNPQWQDEKKKLETFTVGVWANCGFDLYNISSSKNRLFLPSSSNGIRSTLTDRKKPVEGADEIFLSGNGKRACILSTLFDPRGNRGYGQTIHQLRLYDCLNGRLLLTRTVPREEIDYDSRNIWVFSNDGQHFYEVRTQRKSRTDPWDTVELYDWISNKTMLLPAGRHEYWNFWTSPALSVDGDTFAVTIRKISHEYGSNEDEDRTVYVWNLKTQRLLYKFQRENLAPHVLLFSPDNNNLAIGGSDVSTSDNFSDKGRLLLLNARTGRLISTLSEESPRDSFQQKKLQKGQEFARRLGRYKPPRNPQFLPGDSGSAWDLAFSSDSKKLAAHYANGEIKMWKVPK